MARAVSMAVAFTMASMVVQASQFTSGGWCPSDNEPQNGVSLLQTKLQMDVLKDGGEADTKSDFLQLITAPPRGSHKTTMAAAAEQTDDLVSYLRSTETDIGAMIVEPRCNIALPLVVWNMRNSLPSLPIQMFYSDDNADCVSAWFGQMDKMTLTRLNSSWWLGSHSSKDFSWLYTTASFWDEVQHNKVLSFQADSWVCSNAEAKLKHFLEYDYVGAPWPWKVGNCNGVGNGGFSIRDVKVMQKICTRFGQSTEAEDVYYCGHLNGWKPVHAAKVATITEAGDFSAESVDLSPSHSPLGVHQGAGRWLADSDIALCKNCPGLQLLADTTLEAKVFKGDKAATIRKASEILHEAEKNNMANKNSEAEESLVLKEPLLETGDDFVFAASLE